MMYFPYIIVFLVAALVGFGELVARYRDAPLDAVRRLPAFSYVAINGAAGAIALCVIRAFDWTFGAETDSTIQIMQVAVSGFAAMAFLRGSLFTVRVGDADVHAGPSALIKILLDVADRAAMPKARQLGLVLIDVVGEDVLRTSVEALGDEITVSDNT